MSLTVHVWSDVVCPWCFVGKRRLERALRDYGEPVDVVWHSFELDPQRRSEKQPGKSAAERLASKYGMPVERAEMLMEQMRERGKAEGIDFALERGETLQSFDAHRLLHLAALRGVQGEMKERLLLAHFTDGRDLGDAAILLQVAKEVGLDQDEVKKMLAGDAFAEEVRADEAAAHKLGITGVPFFVIGRYGVAGAQSTEVLLQTLDRANLEEEGTADEQTDRGSPGTTA